MKESKVKSLQVIGFEISNQPVDQNQSRLRYPYFWVGSAVERASALHSGMMRRGISSELGRPATRMPSRCSRRSCGCRTRASRASARCVFYMSPIPPLSSRPIPPAVCNRINYIFLADQYCFHLRDEGREEGRHTVATICLPLQRLQQRHLRGGAVQV